MKNAAAVKKKDDRIRCTDCGSGNVSIKLLPKGIEVRCREAGCRGVYKKRL